MKHFLLCIIAVIAAVALATLLQACNVTRTMTTQSVYTQHGDTSIVIQTRTIESYDGSKK